MKNTEIRKNQIMEQLEIKRKLLVSEIADIFEISLPTARRICNQLEKEHRAVRFHGGIRFVKRIYSFDTLDAEYNAEKEAIARKACKLIQNNQNIFLESGTTVKHLAMALVSRIEKGELAHITVFTNSLVNLEILEPVCKVTVIGGFYRPESRDFCGIFCERMIQTLRFNICFLGADALNIKDGIMEMDIESARYNERLVERSDQSIILAHSEKFHKHSLISYCSVHDVSAIYTDSGLPTEIVQKYQDVGVNLICVDVKHSIPSLRLSYHR